IRGWGHRSGRARMVAEGPTPGKVAWVNARRRGVVPPGCSKMFKTNPLHCRFGIARMAGIATITAGTTRWITAHRRRCERSRMTTRRALCLLIVLSGLFRLAWAAGIGPGNDEAYHYLFTTHRDWSYFDHPPMLAVIASVGRALTGGVDSLFTLRLGFVLLFAGSTWLMARLTERRYGASAGLFAAIALNVSAYYLLAAGTFALPDGPLLFFWL